MGVLSSERQLARQGYLSDRQRVVADIGAVGVSVIDGCKQLDKCRGVFGMGADTKDGVVFSTYATLVSAVRVRCRLLCIYMPAIDRSLE